MSLVALSSPASVVLFGRWFDLVGRSEGRRPLGRPRRRWEDNIKMGLREIGFGDVN
jgi:hypothetical protein